MQLDLPSYGKELIPQAARIKMLTHRKRWVQSARPNQLAPRGTDWDIWLLLAGRGFGKTRLAAEAVGWDTWEHEETITHVIAATHGDLRSVCYEGESGLLNIIPPECIKKNGYNRSLGEIHLTNGSIFRGFSAETPSRARGPQCHRLWGDELAAWDQVKGGAQEMFDMTMMGLRLGAHARAILTTTPKPIQLIRNLSNLAAGKITDHNKLLADLRVRLTRGSTKENFDNLARNFKILVSQYAGTRLGRQELDAEILDDIQGALWTPDLIERLRLPSTSLTDVIASATRIVVAIDPAASNEERNDETGIIVGCVDEEGFGYVLEDASGRYSPNEWGTVAVQLYKKWQADCIIGEVNNGGDMVENTIRSIDDNISFKAVRATRGKALRAEPISTLYEQGKIRHVGHFPKLEDQMCAFTIDFSRSKSGYSPDRLDAMVWCITELVLGDLDNQGIFNYYRQLAKNIKQDGEQPPAEEMILMGSNNPGMSDFYDRRGKRYVVASNGTILVPKDCAAVLRQHGFRELETTT